MLLIRRPDDSWIRDLLREQGGLPLTYGEPGASLGTPPLGFDLDISHTVLGAGERAFSAARAAVREWAMFRVSWVHLCWPDAPIACGTVVAVLARANGLWALNVCRIVRVTEDHGAVERFGFTYGTLPAHVECGEESFTVEWDRERGTVRYEIRAVSRPQHILVRIGYPLARLTQRRFARGSLDAMRRAVAEATG